MTTYWILLRALYFAAVMLLSCSTCYSTLLAPPAIGLCWCDD